MWNHHYWDTVRDVVRREVQESQSDLLTGITCGLLFVVVLLIACSVGVGATSQGDAWIRAFEPPEGSYARAADVSFDASVAWSDDAPCEDVYLWLDWWHSEEDFEQRDTDPTSMNPCPEHGRRESRAMTYARSIPEEAPYGSYSASLTISTSPDKEDVVDVSVRNQTFEVSASGDDSDAEEYDACPSTPPGEEPSSNCPYGRISSFEPSAGTAPPGETVGASWSLVNEGSKCRFFGLEIKYHNENNGDYFAGNESVRLCPSEVKQGTITVKIPNDAQDGPYTSVLALYSSPTSSNSLDRSQKNNTIWVDSSASTAKMENDSDSETDEVLSPSSDSDDTQGSESPSRSWSEKFWTEGPISYIWGIPAAITASLIIVLLSRARD